MEGVQAADRVRVDSCLHEWRGAVVTMICTFFARLYEVSHCNRFPLYIMCDLG